MSNSILNIKIFRFEYKTNFYTYYVKFGNENDEKKNYYIIKIDDDYIKINNKLLTREVNIEIDESLIETFPKILIERLDKENYLEINENEFLLSKKIDTSTKILNAIYFYFDKEKVNLLVNLKRQIKKGDIEIINSYKLKNENIELETKIEEIKFELKIWYETLNAKIQIDEELPSDLYEKNEKLKEILNSYKTINENLKKLLKRFNEENLVYQEEEEDSDSDDCF